jgi:hypothetical protein
MTTAVLIRPLRSQAAGYRRPFQVFTHSTRPQEPLSRPACSMNVGAIQNGSLSHEHYSSSPSKTLRAEMGFSFRAAGRVDRALQNRKPHHQRRRSVAPRGEDQRKTNRREPAARGIKATFRELSEVALSCLIVRSDIGGRHRPSRSGELCSSFIVLSQTIEDMSVMSGLSSSFIVRQNRRRNRPFLPSRSRCPRKKKAAERDRRLRGTNPRPSFSASLPCGVAGDRLPVALPDRSARAWLKVNDPNGAAVECHLGEWRPAGTADRYGVPGATERPGLRVLAFGKAAH